MFGKKKTNPSIDKEQLELLENAQKRIKQKRALYVHFIFFLIGSVLLIVANTVLGIGKEFTFFGKEWFLIVILVWSFFLIYHVFNVFVTNRFMGKAWEQKQMAKLVSKQKARIEKIKSKLIKEETLLAESELLSEANENIEIKKTGLTIIVAAAENNAIGKGNKLIWHLSDDLKRFKALTNGHHIIMGRKTFESFPKPLPNRTHVVITRQSDYKAPKGVIIVNSLTDALDASRSDSQPFVIGGGEIYKQALPLADTLELTRVHENFDADTFFPIVDENIWKETANTFHQKDDKHDYEFSFITYTKQ